ncbi:hypothetical protein [Natronococcus jeotgali]|uniref:Uncharacterized protein n=1 Tax=Natronococcus jeotgali DSM 18795 TaxID=1227498 RepID=L9XLJ1_9EURY|nr:hypothetical protein [Natronococcus jeotgali]ELY62605.1 hypothetical protein C492_07690 [Natronococcus jeotgali DSM 18795]
MSEQSIKLGDVCLDLAQGRPVHVVTDTGQTVAEWSEANNYNLLDNYRNSRFGAAEDDRVFDVVYCSSLKSRPSKTYAYPEPRLGRIESEAVDAGRQVADRVVVAVLEELFERAATDDDGAVTVLERYATDVGYTDEAAEARELAEIDRIIGGEV